MTEKAISEKREPKRAKNSNFLRNFTLIAFLLIIVALLVRQFAPVLFATFYSTATEENTARTADSKAIENALEENYALDQEQPLLSFAPEESEEDSGEQLVVDPYEDEVTIEDKSKAATESVEAAKLAGNINDYRLYLANAHKLLAKFESSKTYDLELQILKEHALPADIERIVSLLELYNSQLNNHPKNDEIKLLDSELIAKFIKVRKVSKVLSEAAAMRESIKESLPILIDYIYSAPLQDSFTKNTAIPVRHPEEAVGRRRDPEKTL